MALLQLHSSFQLLGMATSSGIYFGNIGIHSFRMRPGLINVLYWQGKLMILEAVVFALSFAFIWYRPLFEWFLEITVMLYFSIHTFTNHFLDSGVI
jgi:hypothetical protein